MEIKKLTDVIVWADNCIEEMRIDLVPSIGEEEFENLEQIKEFEAVKEVVNNAIKRHTVYTDALKNDIGSKDAKIEKLEKEIEGRKECYTALKELMDTKYISIDEHNKILNSYTDEHNNAVDALNKEIERLNRHTTNVDKVNHDLVTKVTLLESEIDYYKSWNAGLHDDIKSEINGKNDLIDAYEKKYDEFEKKIVELKKERDRHMARVNDLQMELDCVKASKEKHEEAAHDKVVDGLRENITYWRNKYVAAQDEIEKLKVDLIHEREKNEKLAKDHAELENDMRYKKGEDKDHGKSGFETYIRYIISEEEGKFKEELNKRFSEEVSKISMQRTEEELAKAKLNEKGIPCGEDAIE